MAGAFSSAFSSAFDVGGGGGGSSIVLLLALLEDSMNIRQIKKGSTDQSVVIRIVDSTTGLPETAVEHNTTGIDLWYRREGAASVDITEAALSALTDAHSDGGIEHINDGYYRLDLPDAAVASGANGVQIGGTVDNMVVLGCYVHLVDYDPQDTVRMGLTALPNAAADAAGGLPISDAGGLDLDAVGSAVTSGTHGNAALKTILDTSGVVVASIANNAITAAAIANGAIDAATFAADVDAEILSYLVDDATRIDASALNTLSGHDPGATLGTSTLTQTQVTGGAYALNSASFAFNSALDFTTTQKAATLARVTLVDTTTTNTDMRGTDSAALAATALSTAQWTSARAGYLDELAAANLPADIDQIKADLPSKPTKNTALANFMFFMADETDGYTAETGLTITATRSIDGAAFASCTNSASEIGTGVYKIDLSAADLNGDTVMLRFAATGARTRLIEIVTQP